MGLFAGIDTATPGAGGVYFLEGLYRIELVKVFTHKSAKNGDCLFIAECKIVESSVPARPAGMTVSWTVNTKHPSWLGNVKGFAWAVAGDKTTPVGEAEMEFMAGPANPLAGMQLDLECVTIITKEKKQPFTRHDWAPTAGWPAGQ